MPHLIRKPRINNPDLNICIPVYKRKKELVLLFDSIITSLNGINYNLYFLLNGPDGEVKDLVLKKLAKFENTGVIYFEDNIGEDIFIWPLFNLPKGKFWIIGDDDLLVNYSHKAILKSLKYDLTILNYDLYDHNLKNIVTSNYLGREFSQISEIINNRILFHALGEKITFISSVIINSEILNKQNFKLAPKSFQFASLIYNALESSTPEIKVFFEKNVSLKQRGNNILSEDKHITDEIFINDIRLFYLSMLSKRAYMFSAFLKLLKSTFINTPRLLLRSHLEGRHPSVKGFFLIDKLYLFTINIIIRCVPSKFYIFLKKHIK